MSVTFEFCANKESDPSTAIYTLKQCFPINMYIRYDTIVKITCTADEFVNWLCVRNRSGFVNRFRHLNVQHEFELPENSTQMFYSKKFPNNDTRPNIVIHHTTQEVLSKRPNS